MTGEPADLADAFTPALVLDRGRLTRNCERARARCRTLGVALRPHMKTAKSIDVARLAVDPHFGGIAVSTLREADHFARGGFNDIQLAVCLAPDKLERAAAIARLAPGFSFFLDSAETAEALAKRCQDGCAANVWIEIDSGEHRTGVDPASGHLLAIARLLAQAPSIVLRGVATHAGQSYDPGPAAVIAQVAEHERRVAVAAAEMLRQAGVACPGVSVGSTPALAHALSGEGLTEFRAGVFMLGDLFQAGHGSHTIEDIAASVLTEVISRDEDGRRIIVDAGGLALSKDRSTAAPGQRDYGYGLLNDIAGRPLGLTIRDTAQEHGFVDIPAGLLVPAIGTRLRVLVNHVCMAAAMYDCFLVVDGSTAVVADWPKINGW